MPRFARFAWNVDEHYVSQHISTPGVVFLFPRPSNLPTCPTASRVTARVYRITGLTDRLLLFLSILYHNGTLPHTDREVDDPITSKNIIYWALSSGWDQGPQLRRTSEAH
jgi:hypothetical protein